MARNAKEIIQHYAEGKMASRPECYTGIKAEIGDDAAKAFVNMVNGLGNDASATTFLVSLYRLEHKGWVNSAPVSKTEAISEMASAALKNNDDNAMTAVQHGLKGMFAGLYDNETPGGFITDLFLMMHHHEIDNPPDALRIYNPYHLG